VPGAAGFNLCVQWHPEWQAAHNPVSMQPARRPSVAAVRQYHDQYRDRVRGPFAESLACPGLSPTATGAGPGPPPSPMAPGLTLLTESHPMVSNENS
jgi:hypothetical protein